MQFKQYPSYKNSGVEWLCDVPEHWKIVRTKDIFNHRKEEALEDDEIVTAFRDGQVTLRKNRRTDGFTNSLKEHGYQHINSGDLVIHEMDAFAGAIGVSDSSGKSTPVYTVCYAKNENINHHFYSHFFRTMAKTGFINSLAKGIRVRSTEFRWNESRNVYLALPTKTDQQKIVSFLDNETARIDNLIAKQEKLIELLEEQRKSIISHAVTKGLNPNAPMKDSGVEWLGKVPEHWEIISIKFLVHCSSGQGINSLEVLDIVDDENDFPVIGGNGTMGWTSKSNYKEPVLSIGRVGALCGNVHLINYPSWISDNSLILKIYSKKINLEVLQYILLARNLNNLASKSAQPLITGTQVKNEKIALPPLNEQSQILQYIVQSQSGINNLIIKQISLIEKLKEYRSSIISHAVTGKIDVRELVV